ncbi:alpha-(1-_3)-arabinofuranosyltransferase domain-containing protein [Jongsikchunia kroppenstedtii]|uniref:DUF3367 domain-containing protein n=1 Tax=Jongsikchunia kroppenstedtii TaxID=1121721 RepID=UPI000370BA7F|nr:alpha-(1->3)-arabinofuranosyltransferase family protein [Jongsikchunia kroppenstedtii]
MPQRLTRNGSLIAAAVALLLAFGQSFGDIAADTKLDLTADPARFLGRAAHLWSSQAPLGQVQNQAYGYFFPHGTWFLIGHWLHIPPWITQRLWWALLLWVGFVGLVRVAEALAIGSPASRIIAGAAFALSPRVLTTLGAISSETLPMMLAPWALLPVVQALNSAEVRAGPRQLALRSACAVAMMGAVNAAATAAAAGVAVLWFLLHRPCRRWASFGGWWLLGGVLACLWWSVPLLILSRVSPPFLDYIESSHTTTEWTSLTEILRGTSNWTPFVSDERVAGVALVSQPFAVLCTGAVAAAGLAGLTMRRMPFRGRLLVLLMVGVVLIGIGYAGSFGSPISGPIRDFLDGSGAALRNVHKFDPLIRLPLALGIAHLLGRLRLRRGALAHPERDPAAAGAMAVVVALLGASSMAWAGNLAPTGTYRAIPDYWPQTARWLDAHAGSREHPNRALVVPGSPFASQIWGLTRDEPLQGLAKTPWAVRDAIPLTPPAAIRALDTVQRNIADGLATPDLATTLAAQGIRYVVLRADLDPQTSRSTRPLLAQQAIAGSPGLTRVAEFGDPVGPHYVRDVVGDDGLRPRLPAVQIFSVDAPTDFDGTGPSLVTLSEMPRIAGGPEAAVGGPAILDADARRAGLPAAPTIATDTPTDREVDFGRVDDHSSAIRASGDPRSTQNAAADYPVDGAELTTGQWLVDGQPGQLRVDASGSASDATQLGQSAPASSPAAVFDGDAGTSWVSSGLDAAVGQWLRLRFATPRDNLGVTLTVGKALGPGVTRVLVSTETGSTVQSVTPDRPTSILTPSGATRWLTIQALATSNGSAGNQFAIAELGLYDAQTGTPITVRHRTVLPELPAGTTVTGWQLRQEFPGRSACVASPSPRAPNAVTYCSDALSLSAEEPSAFDRVLSVPSPTAVTPTVSLLPKPGTALTALLDQPGVVTATGGSSITDPRGNANAAVDGDPGTSWTASPSSSRPGAPAPTLQLTLPGPTEVRALRVTPPRTQYPAHPTLIGIDLGTGRQVRPVNADGTVTLDPAVTDHITISVLRHDSLLDVNSLGFAADAPTGIGEISVIGPDGPLPAPNPQAPVTISCDDGPSLSIAGRVVKMSLTTTRAALLAGEPVQATVCDPAPIQLPTGEQELVVDPGGAFIVDRVGLAPPGPAPVAAVAQPAQTPKWGPAHRTVTVPAAAGDRVLVIPESVNPGWRATLDGKALRPLTVSGWQQGWIIPAGSSGTVHLDYRYDSAYRWALFGGLGLVAVLVALAFIPARRRAGPVATPWAGPVTGSVAAAVALWLLTGWGVVIAGAAAAGIVWSVRRMTRSANAFGRVLVVTSTALLMVATAGLARGPWHSSAGYSGWDGWIQAFAGTALAVTVTAAVVEEVAARRADSRRRNQSRVGDSIHE